MNHREIFNAKLNEISSKTNKYFKDAEEYCECVIAEQINDLVEFSDIYTKLNEHERLLRSIQINFNIDTIKMLIDREFSSKLNSVENMKNKELISLRMKIESEIERKRREIREINKEIRRKNDEIKEEINSVNSKYKQLEVKRQRLLEYSKEILQTCADYGIKVSDIKIDNDTFTIEELDVFYDEFYTYISTSVNKTNNPVVWIREKTNDNSLLLLFILIGLLVLRYTVIFNFIGAIFILYVLYKQSIQDSLLKKYTIMAGLAFNINPMRFGIIKEISEDMIEKELSEDIDIDNEPEFRVLLEEVNKKASEDISEDVKVEMSKAIASYTKDYPEMNRELNSVLNRVNKEKEGLLELIKKKREELRLRESDLKSKIKLLGTEFSESGILSTKVKLGIDEDTLIYEIKDIGMRNIVFKERGNNKDELNTFIKVLLTNYLCNVRPGFLDVTVYDPNGMGRALSGFYTDKLDNVFSISNDNLEGIIKQLKEHTDNVIRTTKGKTINEYNEEVSRDGRICLNYKLLIILSQPKTIEENEALRSFLEYSADLGVFVWIVGDVKYNNTLVFNEPFEGIIDPIKIDQYTFPIEVMENMYRAFKSLISPSLLWDKFKDRAIPDSSIWTYNADEFIDLDPGFEDGDPSKSRGYTVGNTGDVHALCVGGTGAGKSVFINNLIINIASKYSPKEVSLWLMDFKGTEFSFYLPKDDKHPYMLPHIDACLCTSDPDYSVTLFQALREEADNRFKFLMDEGFKNMYEFNKAMRKEGREERCLKRLLLIVDEFQVIFEKTDAKAQEKLKAHITQISKVARACGVHLFFCSQSMKGTISDDILSQFTLRFGLRCAMEVSMAVMGTRYSGDIREKNGYLYVSSSDDKKKELQKRFRTPFIPDNMLSERIKLLYDRSKKEGFNKPEPITYDERTIHHIEELDVLFKEKLANTDIKDLFILGERMVYSKEGRRVNFKLTRENNQHIFSSFANTKDAVMFFKTIVKNISYNNTMTIYNSQVKDLAYLCELDRLVDDDNRMFCDEGQTPITLLQIFKDIADARKKVKDLEKLKPLYIILIGWDKALGFGIDSNFKITDAYSTLLQTCGVLHMHFIFITSEQGDIPKSIPMSCINRIAGKCSEKTSNTLLDSNAAYKTYDKEDGYMFLAYYGKVERLKIYQSEITRKIKERSLRI